MSPGLLAAPLILAAAGLLGRPMVVRLDRSGALSGPERLLAALAAGCLPLVFAIWTMGAVRYDALSMGALLAVALLAGWSLNRALPRPPSWRPEGRVETVLVSLCLLLVAVEVLTALAPPADHDSLRYHLALARRDLELGRIAVQLGWSAYEFFPPLASLLTRMAFALGSGEGAQILNALWAPPMALAAACVARRLGGGRRAALGAALMVLSTRMVIHLSGGVGVDLPLAVFTATLFLVLLALAERPGPGLAVLTGLVAGGLANIKHQGLVAGACLALPLLPRAWGDRRLRPAFAIAAGTALLMLAPWLVRNGLMTGNPVFPAFHQYFGADNIDVFADGIAINRHGSGLAFLLASPWLVFVQQQRFDGLHFGFPLILIGLPFAVAGWTWQRRAAFAACGLYLAAWVTVMPQMLRFFLPILPLLAALAAVGLARVADIARLRPFLLGLLALAALVQGGFAASTALRKLPAALGVESALDYLEQPAFRWSAHAGACGFVAGHLAGGERWLGLMNDPSYHCPQGSAFSQVWPGDGDRLYTSRPLTAITAAELADGMERAKVRWVLVVLNLGADAEPLVFAKHRYDALVLPALAGLAPVFTSPTASVYDGAAVIAALRERRP